MQLRCAASPKANKMQRLAPADASVLDDNWRRRRAPYVNATLIGSALMVFGIVGAQILSLGLTARPHLSLAVSEPVATSFSRPDIIDRNGRLLATDVEAPSLFADPAIVIDRDEVVEKLLTTTSPTEPFRCIFPRMKLHHQGFQAKNRVEEKILLLQPETFKEDQALPPFT